MKTLRLSFIFLMFIYSTVAYSATVQQIYKKIIIANGFIFYPYMRVSQDSEMNAFNEGYRITMNEGMLKAAKNDHEIAWVLGHELAHSKLRYLKDSYANEYVADKQALIYMTKAGYNKCIGVKILLRFGKFDGETHPSGLKRYNKVKCH